MIITCPHCQSKNRVPENAAGKKGKCPRCGAILDIPTDSGAVEASSSPSTDVADAPAATPEGSQPETIAATPRPDRDDETQPPEGGAPHGLAAACAFLAPPQAPDELGRLGPYRVLQVLGQGGMGIVFVAEDPRLGRQVALKAMLPDVASKPAARDRFMREARTAAAIEHDHIVAIYQVDEDRGVPYIAMPLLRGCSLEDWLRRRPDQPLPVPLILKLGREVSAGLAAAHSHGLIHRDIKPANIFLQSVVRGPTSVAKEALPAAALDIATEDGLISTDCRVKILDFGLARLTAGEQHLTQSGVIMGTPAYMAPEQARSGSSVDARADLFSLGVVLYRLCTGKLPFHGEDMMSTLMAMAMDQPDAPRVLNPELPPALSALVMRLLEKDPRQRPASADEVVQALTAIESAARSESASRAGPELVEAVLIEATPVPLLTGEEIEELPDPVPRRREVPQEEDDGDNDRDQRRRAGPPPSSALSQASMIVGIVSVAAGVLGSCCCNVGLPVSGVGGASAIVLGVVGMKRGGRAQAQAGIALGVAAVCLTLLSLVLLILGTGLSLLGAAKGNL
jgi:predicted Zn finger-like uncharacterized protein